MKTLSLLSTTANKECVSTSYTLLLVLFAAADADGATYAAGCLRLPNSIVSWHSPLHSPENQSSRKHPLQEAENASPEAFAPDNEFPETK